MLGRDRISNDTCYFLFVIYFSLTRPEERGKKINPAELELPEGAQHIQTTNSAVSFTLFYKSASRRLDPLPRHHSDVMDKRDNRRNERNLERRERSPTKYHRSGRNNS